MTPLDPSIALQYKPPQITPYAEQAGQLLSLKSMLGQQQLQSQEIQQRQMDLEDQKTIRQAYMDAGGDMDKFQQLVTQKGVSPRNLMQLNSQILEMRAKQAGLTEAQLKIQGAHNSEIASAAQGLLQLPTA